MSFLFLYENLFESDLNEAELLVHLAKRPASVVGCFLRALFHHSLKVCLVGEQLSEFLLNGSERVCTALTDSHLEVAVALALEFLFDLVH